ncbi:MAG: serine hydrolase [Rhodospirillaceae bacterium]|nr:serine hydrolase [Rhodospirillaceae bacterium]
MNIVTVVRKTAALPIIAVLALAGCGGGGGGDGAGVPQMPGETPPPMMPPPMMPPDMETPGSTPAEEIDISELLTPAIEQSGAPGMIAAIIDEDGVRATGASGVRRQDSPEAMTVDDLVYLKSTTKAMTSTMLATLVADGTFANGWDTTVAEVFPELVGSIHRDYRAVTVAQLVRMRGGLTRNPADWNAYSNNPDIMERRYNILRDNLANAPAGAVGDHLYSNLSYMLAGAMAERLTGMSWEALMEERLFTPLGITSAGYGPPATPGGADQPSGHTPDGSGGWTPTRIDNPAAGGPAGSNLHMSVRDWAKFISLWLTNKEPAILDRNTLNELSTSVMGSYAAGWNVMERHWAGGKEISHGGRDANWRVWVWIAPDRGLAYVAVANAGDREDGVARTLHGIIASLVTNEDLPGGRGPQTPGDHAVQLPRDDGISVAGLRNEDGDLTGLMVEDTAVSVDFHRLGTVRGSSQRPTVGSILQNGDIRIRHIDRHWNMTTDGVSRFEHMSYGAWAAVAPETGGNADFDHRYESIGGGYLVALDEARTSATAMPVSGTASYLGQYTGFFQGHGVGGRIGRFNGDVEMTADFANAAMTVDMLSTRNGRLVLSGAIQGNEFSGNTIDQMSPSSLIESQGATARFSGGFYGGAADEAGGVFEVVGGRPQDPGRLVGAFGGRKDQ